MWLQRTINNLRYDYNLWEPVEEVVPYISAYASDDLKKELSVHVPYMTNEEMSELVYGAPEKPVCFRCSADHVCGLTCPDEEECTPECGACDHRPECDVDEACTLEDPREDPHDEVYEGDDEEFAKDPLNQDQFVGDFDFGKPEPSEEYKKEIVADYDKELDSYLLPDPLVELEHLDEVEEDMVLHPNHYAEADIPSGIECWDWYELAMTEAEVTGHFKGNALKYIFRAGRKRDAIEDLEKARYLARWIGYLKGDRTVHMRGKKNDGSI
jgi:hypothetical protein